MHTQSLVEKLHEPVESDRHYDAVSQNQNPRPARDVPPGECWAFTDHRTVADVIAEGLF